MASAISHIIHSCKFQYKGFSLDARDATRLNNVMHLLRTQGLITKDPVWEKIWLGSQYMKLIACAIVVDALRNGM